MKETKIEFSWFASVTTLFLVSLIVLIENSGRCEEIPDGNSFDVVMIILIVIHGIQLLSIIVSYFFVPDKHSAGTCLLCVGMVPFLGYVYVFIHFLIVDGCD